MFCKNCGTALDDDAVVCPNCGKTVERPSAQEQPKRFCTHCGKEVDPKAYICVNCGCKIESSEIASVPAGDRKSKLAGGLLGIFLGALGVHNFYLGYTGKAVGQLLLSVLSIGLLSWVSAIWGLIEGVMILAGNINTDGKGNPLGD